MTTNVSKAPRSKRSKPQDVYGLDLSNVGETPEIIWLSHDGDEECFHDRQVEDEDVPFIRADLIVAHAEASVAEAARALLESAEFQHLLCDHGAGLDETITALRALTEAGQ